jgi:hypothetical protein
VTTSESLRLIVLVFGTFVLPILLFWNHQFVLDRHNGFFSLVTFLMA